MKLIGKRIKATKLALAAAVTSVFLVAFVVAPIAAATSYHYGYTFYPIRSSTHTDLGCSSRDVAGGEISLAVRQTGYGDDDAERHYYIRMALQGLTPSAPDSGPTGDGWNYPDGDNVFYTYGIRYVKFKVIAEVSGSRATTRGEISPLPTSQTNNERTEVYNSGQVQSAWAGSSPLISLGNTAMGVVTAYWWPIAIATTLISTCYKTMDTDFGHEEWWWWWADNMAQISWDYGYGNNFYSKQPWPEQVNAITWFWWHVPVQSGTYKITVCAEIAYGHYWVDSYGRWNVHVDGYVSTYNYLKVFH